MTTDPTDTWMVYAPAVYIGLLCMSLDQPDGLMLFPHLNVIQQIFIKPKSCERPCSNAEPLHKLRIPAGKSSAALHAFQAMEVLGQALRVMGMTQEVPPHEAGTTWFRVDR